MQRSQLPELVDCHVVQLGAVLEEGSEDEPSTHSRYTCFTTGHDGHRRAYDLSLPPAITDEYADRLDCDETHMQIDQRCVDHESRSIVVTDSSQVHLGSPPVGRRRLTASRTGTKRLLAIRVTTATKEQPSETVEEIQGAVFGLGELAEDNNVLTQYEAVSHGKLLLVPAAGEDIIDGVGDVVVNTSIKGQAISASFITTIRDAATDKYGPLRLVADKIMFCLPDGSLLYGKEDWTGFAFSNESYSFYQQSRCTRLSTVMHELGHSMGFKHSGKDSSNYADTSCIMGYATNQDGGPLKGFNAHKNWISGWY